MRDRFLASKIKGCVMATKGKTKKASGSKTAKRSPAVSTTKKKVVTASVSKKSPAKPVKKAAAKTITPAKRSTKVIAKPKSVAKSEKRKAPAPKPVAKTKLVASAKKSVVQTKKVESTASPKKSMITNNTIGSSNNYMNEKEKAHFAEQLHRLKVELMSEINNTIHNMQDEAMNCPDPSDRATQEEEFSLELRTRDRERKLVRKIDEALMRIESDEYGYCEGCGLEIGLKRLAARPTATQCIDCKTLDEIKERQLGG